MEVVRFVVSSSLFRLTMDVPVVVGDEIEFVFVGFSLQLARLSSVWSGLVWLGGVCLSLCVAVKVSNPVAGFNFD